MKERAEVLAGCGCLIVGVLLFAFLFGVRLAFGQSFVA